jgi:hypothetical protein
MAPKIAPARRAEVERKTRCMQNTWTIARKRRAGTTAADIQTDDHIVGMVVKARLAMARCGKAAGAGGQACR